MTTTKDDNDDDNNNANDDLDLLQVPDIERLMDQSKLRRSRMYRHKTEIMYRSSVINEDRTSVLLHNSPLPDITETGGQPDSISRYLPSWSDDQSVSRC
jgi:hypothetical protein